MSDAAAIAELRQIPGIGVSLARDLLSLGIRRIGDLKAGDPQALYDRLCKQTGQHHDRCVLYTFRCAVYFASTAKPDQEKLKWWRWKDGPAASPVARKLAAQHGLRPAAA